MEGLEGLRELAAALRDAVAGKTRRLIFLLERYGAAIEADLAFRGGWDLGELWRKRRLRFLLNLIEHLPRDSAFTEAVAQDDELARQHADQIRNSKPSPPPVSQFGLTEELLASVYDAVNHLVALTSAVNGGKPKQSKPWPRPETARDRLKRELEREDFLDIVTKLKPDQAHMFGR